MPAPRPRRASRLDPDRSAVDDFFMRAALEQARTALQLGEVPVGAVVVVDGQIVAVGCNQPIRRADPTAHAEVLALRDAAHAIGNYRLGGAAVYVTVEPCLMCVGALVHARVERLIYGATEPRAGAVCSAIKALNHVALNHHVSVTAGVLEDASRQLLQQFFRARRAQSRQSAVVNRQTA